MKTINGMGNMFLFTIINGEAYIKASDVSNILAENMALKDEAEFYKKEKEYWFRQFGQLCLKQ